MSYYDEEQYYEPSLADEVIAEFKERMQDVLLESVKCEISNLSKLNKELQLENKRLKDRQDEVFDLERKVQYEKDNLKRIVRNERLSELLKDFQIVMYKAYNEGKKPKKCNKCNDNRKIVFKSPSGKEMQESCNCSKDIKHYAIEEYYCSEFRLDRDNKTLLMWYKHDDEYESYSYKSSNFAKVVYSENMIYDDLDYYDTYFKDKEECQKYCDWLNNN
jgi:hypothetical protein